MATAIMLKPNLRILAITPSRHLSSSPLPPLPNKNPLSDIKKNLKPSQPPSHVVPDPPPSPPSSDNGGKTANISEIQMHLSRFRQQNPFRNANPNSGPISIQDIMNRRANNQNTQNKNTRMNFDAMSESLKNFRPNPQSSMRGFNLFPNRRNLETPTVGNLEKSKLPESVFGKELREKFGGVVEEAETGKLASTEFLKIYTNEELGQKLMNLKPEDSGDGKYDWFSLEELEQKEKDQYQKVHGLSVTDLTDSLKHITQRETMNRNKLAAQSMSNFGNFNPLSLMTPNYMLNPPQEQLLDNHFHPDHMSSAEKMKLELKKVRDEYKMSESDCGSTHVQKEIQAFDSTPDTESQNIHHPARKSQRARNFSRDEDIYIVSAWLNTSKDAVHEVDQCSSRFWNRIYNQFIASGGQKERIEASIKNRWRDINAKCAKFIGCTKQIDDRHQSGQTDHGRLAEARELYASINNGKPFQFDHCLDLLKQEKKWLDTLSKKKQTCSSQADDKIADDDDEIVLEQNDRSKYTRKASKEQIKKQKRRVDEENNVATNLITDERWKEKIAIEHAKLEQRERLLGEHQKMRNLEEARYEMEVMAKDTSGMDPLVAAYWDGLKQDIMIRKGLI